MMIELAIVLSLTAILLELAIVGQFRFLAQAFQRHSLSGILFSVGLSYAVGELFGASGTVVLIAALASTIATTTLYKVGGLDLVHRLTGMVSALARA